MALTDVKAKVEDAQKSIDFAKKNYQVELDTSMGKIKLDMLPEAAPGHVKNFVALAKIDSGDHVDAEKLSSSERDSNDVVASGLVDLRRCSIDRSEILGRSCRPLRRKPHHPLMRCPALSENDLTGRKSVSTVQRLVQFAAVDELLDQWRLMVRLDDIPATRCQLLRRADHRVCVNPDAGILA